MKENVRMIPLEDLTVLPEAQCRTAISQEQVAEFSQFLLGDKEAELDPLDGFVDAEKRIIVGDGAGHRFLAYKEAKRKTIPVIVRQGNVEVALSNAIESAITHNVAHGLKLSNNDKRRAVSMVIQDKELRKRYRGDGPIARLCRVSPQLVADVRKNGEKALAPRKKRSKTIRVRGHKRAAAGQGDATEAIDIQSGPSEQAILGIRKWLDNGDIDVETILRMLETPTRVAVMMPKLPIQARIKGGSSPQKITIVNIAIGQIGVKELLVIEVANEDSPRPA